MKKACQSCGIPLKNENYGTEKDGSKSSKYCNLCYKDGSFTQPDITLDEMKLTYVEAMREMHFPRFIAKVFANNQVPKLERWNR